MSIKKSILKTISFSLYILAGSDYEAAFTGLLFSEDQTQRCVNITILEDGSLEPPEDFELLLTVAPEDRPVVMLAPNRTRVLITDDDGKQ